MKEDFAFSPDFTSDGNRSAEAEWKAVLARLKAAEQQILAIRGLGTLADLRDAGWSVAVHNDYHIDGQRMTFWLFTRGRHAIKGEGATDAFAIDIAAKMATTLEQETR